MNSAQMQKNLLAGQFTDKTLVDDVTRGLDKQQTGQLGNYNFLKMTDYLI